MNFEVKNQHLILKTLAKTLAQIGFWCIIMRKPI
jgi:hypothetical protein